MKTVEPIRDINTVMDIADYLKSKNERDYVMFMLFKNILIAQCGANI